MWLCEYTLWCTYTSCFRCAKPSTCAVPAGRVFHSSHNPHIILMSIMSAVASQITSLVIVYSTVYSGVDQRKDQSSASLAFVRGIHRWPVNSPHKRLVTRKMFPFDDVIMKWNILFHTPQIDGLVQERRNSIANALELRLSCTNPSKCSLKRWAPSSRIYFSCSREGEIFTTSIQGTINCRNQQVIEWVYVYMQGTKRRQLRW